MKRTLLFSAFMMVAAGLFAQGSLEFNQVKLVSSSESVPSGKVWKVTSVLGPATTTSGSPSSTSTPTSPADHIILVNGNSIAVADRLAIGAGGAFYANSGYRNSWATKEISTSLPFWLPESTSLAASTNVTYVSVIEFNVVP